MNVTTTDVYQPRNHVRIITAASLFDGHDASINIMRRILQKTGCEVVHLGHNRSVSEIIKAAIEEDAQGIAVTSYQGGHNEFFRYIIDELKARDYGHIKVFGGGGGVILPAEIETLHNYGVSRIYSPEDGRLMGLQGMINHMVELCDFDPVKVREKQFRGKNKFSNSHVLRLMTSADQNGSVPPAVKEEISHYLKRPHNSALVLGITGTGGAGKSSLSDELILRMRHHFPDRKILVLCVDPTIRRSGGSLLGDRIRMNAIECDNVVLRSLATRQGGQDIGNTIKESLELGRRADFDLILLETPGIGQGDSSIIDHCDLSLYVMTSEFGAPSQLEKISMLDYADLVAINKFERQGSEDAYREVCRAIRRNKNLPSMGDYSELPVFGTSASRFNDEGVTALFIKLLELLNEQDNTRDWSAELRANSPLSQGRDAIVPANRVRYLSEISEAVRNYKVDALTQSQLISQLHQLKAAAVLVKQREAAAEINKKASSLEKEISPEALAIYQGLDSFQNQWNGKEFLYHVRGKEIKQPLTTTSLSGLNIPRVSLPTYWDPGRLVFWRLMENVPGEFPFVAGLFPLKRQGEDPARMFAGEGEPARTNKRFHLLSEDQPANRLSTAFDSVTLYGEDPARRPDIYGKVGESGVSVCSVENMERLYAGFDLCDPRTSVSMTINGPAPIILAFYMNTAIRQQCRLRLIEDGKLNIPPEKAFWPEETGHWEDTRQLLSDEEYQSIADETVTKVRGTVQADILKEDQAQNTCILSTEFALRLMADIQEWFIEHHVKNYYSVSISGYHIAEAGANPISQLAFTLANGFTYVENYLSRGMKIDDFASNLSFFFSNGLDPEYQVIGRVARRIWAIAIRDVYQGNEKSQKLKYHIQTSGRSLHAQEIDFNDIRTTLQALMALYDNCNSLHTNAYDEAITTPTTESVRRALAIQMIINHEFGGSKNENPLQGSFIIEELTELVEEAVLQEFDRLTARGGVLGAMETQYQRSRIQEESLYYESQKHDGRLPIIGVNTFLNPNAGMASANDSIEVARATPEEKERQLKHVADFQKRHEKNAEASKTELINAARHHKNLFDVLLRVSNQLTLGQITDTLYQSGGKYRRNI